MKSHHLKCTKIFASSFYKIFLVSRVLEAHYFFHSLFEIIFIKLKLKRDRYWMPVLFYVSKNLISIWSVLEKVTQDYFLPVCNFRYQ